MRRTLLTTALLAAAMTAGAQLVLDNGDCLYPDYQGIQFMPSQGHFFINTYDTRYQGKPIDMARAREMVLADSLAYDYMAGPAMSKLLDESDTLRLYSFVGYDAPLRGLASSVTAGLDFRTDMLCTAGPATFIIPTDQAMAYYLDIYSFTTKRPVQLQFSVSGTSLRYAAYSYDPATGETGYRFNVLSLSTSQLGKMMRQMLLSHTVMAHLDNGNRYFRARNGEILCLHDDGTLSGTYERPGEDNGHAKVVAQYEKNGVRYVIIDRPLQSNPRSAYDFISTDPRCAEFLSLYNELNDEGHGDEVFASLKGADLNLAKTSNCSYTLFVPTNEAIQAERNAGRLATWQQKRDFMLYHTCYGNTVADRNPFAAEVHRSTLVEEGTLRAPALTIASAGGGTLTVTDVMGNTRQVVEDGANNFTFEFQCTKSPNGLANMSNIEVTAMSPGVVHIIDGVLRHN